MTLVPGEFIRRFLLHVLPKGFHRIRHYGLLASAARKANIARARELLAAPEPPTVPDATTKATATAPNRPSPAMPVLRRAHDHRRDLRARRRPARPASVRTRDQDRGRMTPNRRLTASQARRQAGAAGDSPTTPSSDRSYAPDRQSHRHRPAWARETALCATPVAIAPPTKPSRASIKPAPVPPPTVGNRQIPIDPNAEPGPRGFLPWRLSDAGPRRCSLRLDRPASETLHNSRPSGRRTVASAAEGKAAETPAAANPLNRTVRSLSTPPGRGSSKPAPHRLGPPTY